MTDVPELRLVDALFRGDADAAVAMFDGTPVLDVPRFGRLEGGEEVARLSQEWAKSFNVLPGEHVEPRYETGTPAATVTEIIARVAGPDGEVRLPMAVVGERAGPGRLRSARLYHAHRPVTGHPAMRPNPFPVNERSRPIDASDLPGINAVYFQGLNTQNLDMVLSALSEDAWIEAGTLRASSRQNLSAVFRLLISNKIQLHASATWDDGRTFVLEWSNGGPAFSGLAAYGRTVGGLIDSIRMYDDMDLGSVPDLVSERAW
jgi:hypothetical protein